MTDLTLDDLTDTSNDTDENDTGTDDGDDGLGRLFDYMIEQGYIDALAAQQFDVDMTDTPTDTQVESGNDDGGADLDAEAVSQFGKLVIDNVGDVPMSQVVKFAEQNPEQVNSLIDDVLE